MKKENKNWQTYEEVSAYLLNKFADTFNLDRVQQKQDLHGNLSGTNWEIDAKGIKEDNQGFVIIECRQYTTSKQNQEKLGALAYKILDTGAESGIIVSPLGLQKGAKKIANAENILNIQLNANCTPHEFTMQFLNKLFIGLEDKLTLKDKMKVQITRKCKICGRQYKEIKTNFTCPHCKKINNK